MRTTPSFGQTAVLKVTNNVDADYTQTSTSFSKVASRADEKGAQCQAANFPTLATPAGRPYPILPNDSGEITMDAEL